MAGIDGPGVGPAIDFIRELRQCDDLSTLPVGRDVVVIGGGMTAVDAAVQAKLLGAETVSLVYRRGRDRMPASGYEQDLAAAKGVRLIFNAQPLAAHAAGAGVEVEFARTDETPDGLKPTGDTFRLPADQVHLAVGQWLDGAPEGLALADGKLAVTGAGRSSLAGVWVGGDCASGGEDLTVTAVAEGRDAAEDIHAVLMA